MSRTRAARWALIPLIGLVAGCSNSLSGSDQPTSSASTSLPPVQQDATLHSQLPQRIQGSGQIVVGNAPNYKPVEFLEDGQPAGLDIDLFNAVGQKLGVTMVWKQSAFDQILIGMQAKKYDMGASAFTVKKEREKSFDMVSYLSAGSSWAVQKGNPKHVEQGKPCGHTVAVQTGTVQFDEMKAAQAKCSGSPMNLLPFGDQGEATAALVNGRADVIVADSPVAQYAVKMNSDKLENLGDAYDAAPYGTVTRKDEPELAKAIAAALTELKADGHYDAILAKWGQTPGAVEKFQVNP